MKIVNAIGLVALVFGVIMLASCGTDTSKDIAGKWKYAEWSLGGSPVDLNAFGNPTIEFTKEGNYVVEAGLQKNTEKYELKTDTLLLHYKDGESQHFFISKHTTDTIALAGLDGEIETQMLWVRIKE